MKTKRAKSKLYLYEVIQMAKNIRLTRQAEPPQFIDFNPLVDFIFTSEDDSAEAALNKKIENLPDEEKMELLAHVWFGRGDFPNLNEALKRAETFDMNHVADYLCAMFPLDRYLFDSLPLKGCGYSAFECASRVMARHHNLTNG